MVRSLTSEEKKGFLRGIYGDAKKSAKSLNEGLEDFHSIHFNRVKSGSLVVSTSGGGYSTQLKTPESGNDFRMLGFAGELLDVYADALVTVANNAGDATNDEQLFACMMADDRLNAQRSSHGDFTLIGVQNSFGSR